jgi:predicted aldo/keto reductase-like oxidoreductase
MEKTKKRMPVKLRIKKDIPTLTEENIETVFNENFEKIDLDNVDYNTYLNTRTSFLIYTHH